MIDLAAMERLSEKIVACRGSLLISGVGKSGHIAEKIAATFVSVGKRAHFLSPLEALHGALGLVSPEDLLIALSKSGETRELLDLIPFVRAKGVYTVACVSRLGSSLAKLSDQTLYLPSVRELCPHDLAPTTSTVIQLLVGDCLAVAWMEQQGITADQFARNHPGGLLGTTANRYVKDLMLQGVALPVASPTMRLIDALAELSEKRCGALLIVDAEQTLRGIFTDGDLRRFVQKEGALGLEAPLQHVMNPTAKTIHPEASLGEAIDRMEEGPLITVLPVVADHRLVGLLRMHDILQARATR